MKLVLAYPRSEKEVLSTGMYYMKLYELVSAADYHMTFSVAHHQCGVGQTIQSNLHFSHLLIRGLIKGLSCN